MFENLDIAPGELPAIDALEWQRLDSRYIPRLQLQAVITISVTALVLAGLQVLRLPLVEGWMFGLAWLVVVCNGFWSLLWPLVSVPRMGYAIRERDIVYRSGVLWQTVTAVPLNRVQHVETSSTPLDRRFTLASLQLFTAGGSGGDLRISGMPADVAERLRLYILEKAGSTVEHDG